MLKWTANKKEAKNLIPGRSKISEPSLGMGQLERWEGKEEDESEGRGKSPKVVMVASSKAKKKNLKGRTEGLNIV